MTVRMINAGEVLEAVSGIGLEVSESQAGQLSAFANLLLRWNRAYNLTRIEKPEDVLSLHIADSLTLVKAFPEISPAAAVVVDAGSGGGLPGIPLAVMRTDLSVTMVDSVRKKVLFLRQAVLETGLANASALHARVETLSIQADVVTSRAFAALPLMVELTKGLLRPEGRWVAMKGKVPEDEIRDLPPYAEVEKIMPLRIPGTAVERHLIVLKHRRSG